MSLHLHVFLVPFLWLSFFLPLSSLLSSSLSLPLSFFFVFVFVLFYFILLLSVRCPFFDENQEGGGFRWEGREVGRILKELERGNCNQNIMFEKHLT